HSIGRGWSVLRRLLYSRSQQVIVQTQRNLEYYPESIRRIARVIPSPVVLPTEVQLDIPQRPPGRSKVVIAMGRLVEQKGFDVLLHAFRRVASKHPAWALDIWGEGGKRDQLESLITELGLRERVRLCGVTRQPFERLGEADIFVLSS